MSKYSRPLFLVTIVSALFGCARYGVTSFTQDAVYGSSCPTPKYITTMSYGKSDIKDTLLIGVYPQEVFTLSYLLIQAREKYGDTITISNVRWDVKGRNKKVGAIFDVVVCGSGKSTPSSP